MAGFDDEFVQLKCPNCGGKVKISREQQALFKKDEEEWIFYPKGGERIVCEHCGAEFERRQIFTAPGVLVIGSGAVAIGPGSVAVGAGGIAIGGDVHTNGGAFIGGNVDTGGGKFFPRDDVSTRGGRIVTGDVNTQGGDFVGRRRVTVFGRQPDKPTSPILIDFDIDDTINAQERNVTIESGTVSGSIRNGKTVTMTGGIVKGNVICDHFAMIGGLVEGKVYCNTYRQIGGKVKGGIQS